MRIFALTGAILLMFSALPGAAGEALRKVPVNNNFSIYEHKWPQNSGGMIVHWDDVIIDGTVWICGAVVHINDGARRANRGLLRKGWIRRAGHGRDELRNLSYFTFLKNGRNVAGSAATCKSTGQRPDNQQYIIGFDPHNVYDAQMGSF